MLVRDIIDAIESFAPPALQEEYDNSGFIIGDKTDECSGVLLTVDVTPEVVHEAKTAGCNLIVSHHPLIFSGIKRLDGSSRQQKAIMAAIRNEISIYAAHTSLDIAPYGVSQRMASMLGLSDIEPLESKEGTLLKLQVYVPEGCIEIVRDDLFKAGAGRLGNYDACSFSTSGTGTFRAREGANPFVGCIGEFHREKEVALQMVLPVWRRNEVEKALLNSHPYETPAYEFVAMHNHIPGTGLGAVGTFEAPMLPGEFIEKVKSTFDSPIVRCSNFNPETQISRLALCGGSGGSLIRKAISSGAQAYLTSDVKYHDFIDYPDNIIIVDIGHHESENCSKKIFYDIISEKFPNFAIRNSQADINPINYL